MSMESRGDRSEPESPSSHDESADGPRRGPSRRDPGWHRGAALAARLDRRPAVGPAEPRERETLPRLQRLPHLVLPLRLALLGDPEADRGAGREAQGHEAPASVRRVPPSGRRRDRGPDEAALHPDHVLEVPDGRREGPGQDLRDPAVLSGLEHRAGRGHYAQACRRVGSARQGRQPARSGCRRGRDHRRHAAATRDQFRPLARILHAVDRHGQHA